jgi:hypothetical protein
MQHNVRSVESNLLHLVFTPADESSLGKPFDLSPGRSSQIRVTRLSMFSIAERHFFNVVEWPAIAFPPGRRGMCLFIQGSRRCSVYKDLFFSILSLKSID